MPDSVAPIRLPNPVVDTGAFGRKTSEDFDGLEAAGNDYARGIWVRRCDDVGGGGDHFQRERDLRLRHGDEGAGPRQGFHIPDVYDPSAIWSDGVTMWVKEHDRIANWAKFYAYDMATKARVPGKDFEIPEATGNGNPSGIWSDGVTMWVTDYRDNKIYAYDLATKARIPGKDFDTLQASVLSGPQGIWSDGVTMWVANSKIYAYDMATKARVPGKDFATLSHAGFGIWSDGVTMWVAYLGDDKIYAYHMPDSGAP